MIAFRHSSLITHRSKKMAAVMETIYADAFKRFLSADEGPSELRRLREEAFAHFTSGGFPALKSEDWKYTNVAPVAAVEWDLNDLSNRAPADIDYDLLTRFDFA